MRMKVKELRAALEGADDDADVIVTRHRTVAGRSAALPRS
jgi:hypothetical protein